MAYDAARGVTVLFGGWDDSNSQGDTWEWDGSTWAEQLGGGPSPRYGHAMAYDAARGVVVLFGGYDGSNYHGDTWEWDGDSWMFRSSSGPSVRSLARMAYDAARGVVVLFGGYDGSLLGDTWEWDGASWVWRASSGPPLRWYSAMAYDAARGVVVLFGGDDGSYYLGDTWEWNGVSWTLVSTGGPSPRYAHGMAYDTARGVTVLFGGRDGSDLGDTWEWDGANWWMRSATGPSARHVHAMAYDSARGVTVLFGGYDGSTRGDTWEYDACPWTRRATTGPSIRYLQGMTYDSAREVTVLFGGRGPGSTFYSDTWKWDGDSWADVSPPGSPSARQSHALVYDAAREVGVLFGGWSGTNYLGDTWEWNGASWVWRASSGPSPRDCHAMAYDAARGVSLLFGGRDGTNYLDDTWLWNGNTWSAPAVSGPSARRSHALVYDAAREVTVLFGGHHSTGYLADTWEWDGESWSLRSVSGPSARMYPAMAYDAARGVTVLFGGLSGTNHLDTWEWDGESWSLRSVNGPSARYAHTLAYDVARGVTVLFGGHVDGCLGDTWELAVGSPRILQQPGNLAVEFGEAAVFSVTAAGAWPLTYQWRHDGEPLADGGNISGATTNTLTIDPVELADAGTYDVLVSDGWNETLSDPATLTVDPSSIADHLVLWNKMGSQAEIENSVVGLDGTITGGGFTTGMFGDAYLAAYTEDNLVNFPKEVIPLGRGCIAFWAKLIDPPTTMGEWAPAFFDFSDGASRYYVMFTANNGQGSGGLCFSAGDYYTGGTGTYGTYTYEAILGAGQEQEWHHYALVWDEDTLPGIDDGTRKVVAFLDGEPAAGRWYTAHDNGFPPLGGGVLEWVRNDNSQGSVAVDNVRIWDYAKLSFADRFAESPFPTYQWIGPDGGLFTNPANWNPTGVPNAAVELINTTENDNTCLLDAAGETETWLLTIDATSTGLQTLQIDDGAALTSAYGTTVGDGGQVHLTGGELDGDDVANAGRVFGSGAVAGTIDNAGTVESFAGGDLVLTGAAFTNRAGATLRATFGTMLNVQSAGMTQSGLIDVRSSASMLFAQPLVNEADADISLMGGSLSADGLTNALGADIDGFGTIETDVSNDGDVTLIADTQIVGDLVNNGTITVQNGTLTIVGTLTNNGIIIGDFYGRLRDDPRLPRSAGDGFFVQEEYIAAAGSSLLMSPAEAVVRIGGDFDVAIDDFNRFDLTAATLQLVGLPGAGPQCLEVLAENVGRDVTLPDASLFSLNELRIGPTATTVNLVDAHDNAPGEGNETLYVNELVLEEGITLDLGGLRLYYATVTPADPFDPGSGVTVIDSIGGGGLIPIGPPIPGDWDDDADVDLADFVQFPECLTGPNNPPVGQGCEVFDFESDVDVDLTDFAAFQMAFGGP